MPCHCISAIEGDAEFSQIEIGGLQNVYDKQRKVDWDPEFKCFKRVLGGKKPIT